MARNFYVDNLLICSETPSEAVAAIQTARRTMANAGMNLREFVAADPSILSALFLDDVLPDVPSEEENGHFSATIASVVESQADPPLLNPRRFNSWSKLLTTTTFVFFF
ncbi:hypothetical protein niasHT_000421 [Heterodera trifolii]|uniref:Uncharacterized protein n=1 Tax=Heterodera trifolii TaxID=157864 RepID=A0ABD2M6K8_9BILA